MRLFIGGYSPELYMAELDSGTGAVELLGSVKTPENASFLAYSKELRTLYATVETGYKSGESGKVVGYRVDGSGTLTAIGSVSTGGAGPCHLDIDETRRLLAVANYGGRSFSVIRLDDDGTPLDTVACVTHTGSSVNVHRQREPHPHSTLFSPDRDYLLVCDLGTDRIEVYRVDDLIAGVTESAGSIPTTPGAGPRHLLFSPDSRYAYCVNELSNTVAVFSYAPETGDLSQQQEVSTLPDGIEMDSLASEIQIDSAGEYVYVSNRGHDSITVFTRDEATGQLERRGFIGPTGATPRHFSIDPSGMWCVSANQDGNSVVSFKLNPQSGLGAWSGHQVTVTAPTCVSFRL